MFCLTATSIPLQIRFEGASVKLIRGGFCLGEALPLGLQTRRCVGPFLEIDVGGECPRHRYRVALDDFR
jgi:hypothetical protein